MTVALLKLIKLKQGRLKGNYSKLFEKLNDNSKQ
jgi:hypothetical protein